MNGSKHRTTDGSYESRKDSSNHSSIKRELNTETHESRDDSSNHRKYIRTQSSSNNRTVLSSSSSHQQRQNGDKNKKTVQETKIPLRVFGDWSEFKSSTGQTYFYNCKTEISRWEKPKGWPSDESSSRSSTSKKESTNVNNSSSNHSRHKTEKKSLSNGISHSHESLQSTETSNNRLPSPTDDNSRMSFSSTISKESSSEPAISSDNPNKDSNSINENTNPSEQITENEPSTPSISKAERDQEIQKYYRADLIQHLTDWPSTQLEKQCLKLFDDYYGYSAKISPAFIELKALKSNFRVLEIRRSILTQRLLRCAKHVKEREDDKLL